MPGRILIADDRASRRILLKAQLSATAQDVVQAASGAELLAAAAKTAPDLVVISDSLPDESGAALCQRLRAGRGGAGVPVILIGRCDSRAARIAALRSGADAVLEPQPGAGLLQAWARSLLRRRAAEQELARDSAPAFGFAEAPAPALTPPGEVALIAPGAAAGLAWKQALSPLIRDRITLLSPDMALHGLCPTAPPDAIVIAGCSGDMLRLVSNLRCRSETLRSAILVVQDAPGEERAEMALDLGVSDLVETGFDAEEMALRLRRALARKAQSDSTRLALKDGLRMAVTDPLTGLWNRRYALRVLESMPEGDRPADASFAVMVLDLDRFKQVNDRHGHAAGDAVLVEVARRMQRCLRHHDVLARIGGEEFLAVIRGCDVVQARRAAERLRRAVSARPIALPGNAGALHITMSAGLVVCDGAEAPATLIDRADRALYVAKADGRDQVTMSQHAA